MGIFDKVFGSKNLEPKELTVPEAFAGIALAASAADGHISDVEIRSTVTALRNMKLFSNYNPDQMVKAFDRGLGILKREGVGGLVTAAKDVLPPDLKETAFAVAVDVVLADGTVEEGEKDLIAHLQQGLGINDDLAVKIIEVMIIKNRG